MFPLGMSPLPVRLVVTAWSKKHPSRTSALGTRSQVNLSADRARLQIFQDAVQIDEKEDVHAGVGPSARE